MKRIHKLWKDLKVRLIRILSTGLEEEKSTPLANTVTRPVPLPSTVPGIPCPQCGFTIVTDMMSLISGKPLSCQHCKLELTIDREHSAESLKALERYNNRMQKLASVKQKLTT